MAAETKTETFTIGTRTPATDTGKDVGAGATWTVSGSKAGAGIANLLDDSEETFWQSDGVVPHTVTIQFHKKCTVSRVYMYLNYSLDESYTPQRIGVLVGSSLQDLRETNVVSLEEPNGWVCIDVLDPALVKGTAAAAAAAAGGPTEAATTKTTEDVTCHVLQVSIRAMHQNGRDTHVRKMRVYGPKGDTGFGAFHQFREPAMTRHACIR